MSLAAVATYTWGQCTYYAAKTLDWVQGHWGNANQWAAHARAEGYPVDRTPAVNSVATFDTLGQSGHVAVVEAVSNDLSHVTVGEMNWTGVNQYSQRTIPTSSVSEFIHPKGAATTASAPTASAGPLGYPDWAHALLGPLADLNPQDLLTRVVLVILGLAVIALGVTVLVGKDVVTVVQETAGG